ncbi:MAG: hypothetical protein JWN78_3343 [Bacteroidota bacterium]|nr:hypothetical protein [Bacteroidota bacterium]
MKNRSGILLVKIFFLSIPVFILLGSYIYYDPKRILHNYANYQDSCFIELDRDYVSNEVYIKNAPKYGYNAFIFGNSRSLAFLCSDWKQYIDGSIPFHYDAFGESLIALRDKVKYIDGKKGKINYALIVLDHDLLSKITYGEGPIFIPHPSVSNISWLSFQYTFFELYINNFYFIKYIDYYYHRKYKPNMIMMIDKRPWDYNPVTNDLYCTKYDLELEKDPSGYIINHFGTSILRDTSKTVFDNASIGAKQIRYLSEIKTIFDKHHTNFKIVVSPLFNQKYLNKNDIKKLHQIFGSQNVNDYSGKNEYTRNIENYYETSHYRPKVARDILKKIYGAKIISH